jgi:hypothetical protein
MPEHRLRTPPHVHAQCSEQLESRLLFTHAFFFFFFFDGDECHPLFYGICLPCGKQQPKERCHFLLQLCDFFSLFSLSYQQSASQWTAAKQRIQVAERSYEEELSAVRLARAAVERAQLNAAEWLEVAPATEFPARRHSPLHRGADVYIFRRGVLQERAPHLIQLRALAKSSIAPKDSEDRSLRTLKARLFTHVRWSHVAAARHVHLSC